MITRLKVVGFKNLENVDLYLGPFNCIAGPNGVGKSNLFDAIQFLSALADRPIIEAIQMVRGGDDPYAIFSRHTSGKIELLVEMIIPRSGRDDFGQPASASATFLQYKLELRIVADETMPSGNRIRVVLEELNYLRKGAAKDRLGFDADRKWVDSVIVSTKRTRKFISSEEDAKRGTIITLSADRMKGEGKSKRGGGKPPTFSAEVLPRTVLSSAQNADEHRTAVLVRQEMRAWRQLQLEPSYLRAPDNFDAPDRIDTNGAHIPSTLWRLKNQLRNEDVETEVANALSALVEGVQGLRVERDDSRRVLRLMMRDQSGLELPASSLSDGTMRFVALAVVERDPKEIGVICLEEPENGIHPQRIGAMLGLLYDIASDASIACDQSNPLRQVLISTHSPIVAGKCHRDDVIFARRRKEKVSGELVFAVEFVGIEGSWRHAKNREMFVKEGEVVSFLAGSDEDDGPVAAEQTTANSYGRQIPFRFERQ